MTRDELIARANEGNLPTDREVNKRLLRYLTDEGLLLGPTGGLRSADYPEENVAHLHLYREMRRAGYRLRQILPMVREGDTAHTLCPGMLLLVSPGAFDRTTDSEQVGRKAASIAKAMSTAPPIPKITRTYDDSPTDDQGEQA